MASNIQTYLNNIMNAIYGRDVRSSIHDAIELCYDDVSAGKTTAESSASAANSAATAANNAATAATDAKDAANSAATAANNAASAANSARDATVTATTNANQAATAANTARTNAVTATTNANNARDAANAAATAANQAATAATNAKDAANTATTNATNAASAANTAAGNANTATTTANQAAQNADAKAALASTATNNATTATTNANIAASGANEAKDAANTAATAANTARDAANNAASAANQAATRANNAATAANTAATTANNRIADMEDALSDASTAISDANSAAYNANVATTNANRATDRANTAAASIEGLTVDSEDGGPNSTASATLQTVSGHRNIHFVLKQGRPGTPFTIKGQAYATVSALEADVLNPEVGDQYNVGSAPPYNVYRWTGSSWEDQGTIGAASDPITAQDVQTIQNGGTVDNPTGKVLKVDGLTYILQTLLTGSLDDKVDKVEGKGLSTNDFTDSYKNTVDTLETNVTLLGSTKVDKVSGKGLSTNDFTNALKTQTQMVGTGTLTTEATTLIPAINELDSEKEDVSNKVTAFQNTPDNTHYPSEQLVKTALDLKAPLASPTFTGTPRLTTTPIASDSSTAIASTQFVKTAMSAVKNVGYLEYEIVS